MNATPITLLAAAGLAVGLLVHGSADAANCETLGKSTALDAYVRIHEDAQGIRARDEKLPGVRPAGKADALGAATGDAATLPVVYAPVEPVTPKRTYAAGTRRLSGVLSY